MSQVITKRSRVSRRRFLQGLSLAGGAIQVGLPPLVSMFNSTGTAYAADGLSKAIENRFVFWFNGNGIPERYWIPGETGTDFRLTPCLSALPPALRLRVTAREARRSIRRSRPGSDGTRGSARSRWACRRNRSAKAFSAT